MHSTALYTDHYELTMLASALRDGSADLPCVFEVFARRLPAGRRYGVVAGAARLLDAIEGFRFGPDELDFLARTGVVGAATRDWLAGYRFRGDVDGYAEGELYFPNSPVLTVSGTFAEAVVLETLALSVLNHDCAVASAAARMVVAAGDRPLIEMGSRRTHEEAAVAAARAAYLAGFASSSNLAAGRRYGVPTTGTAAHSITLLASAYNLAPDALWFPPLIETLIAMSIIYMALENIVSPQLQRRWMITFGFGLVHGFGFSFALKQTLQFAGSHLLASLLSFNVGVELGQLLVLVLFVPALSLLFRFVVAERLGTIILSALVTHTAWHWTTERFDVLRRFRFEWPAIDAAFWVGVMRWAMIAVVAIGLYWLVFGVLKSGRPAHDPASSRTHS